MIWDRRFLSIAAASLVLYAGLGDETGLSARSGETALLDSAARVLQRALSGPAAISPAVLRAARAFVVLPAGRRGDGFRYGRGVVGARSPEQGRWLLPAFVSFKAVVRDTPRARAGDIILVAISRRGFDFLAQDESALPEGLRLPPGPIGINSLLDMEADILAYARYGRLLAGVTIEDLALVEDSVGIEQLYGQSWPLRDLLYGRVERGPAVAFSWRNRIESYYREIR